MQVRNKFKIIREGSRKQFESITMHEFCNLIYLIYATVEISDEYESRGVTWPLHELCAFEVNEVLVVLIHS